MNINNLISTILLASILGFGCEQEKVKQPNILFISIDDLNDWEETMGGNPQALHQI